MWQRVVLLPFDGVAFMHYALARLVISLRCVWCMGSAACRYNMKTWYPMRHVIWVNAFVWHPL